MTTTAGLAELRALVARLGNRVPEWLPEWLETVEAVPEHVRPRLLGAVRELAPATAPVIPAYEGPLCPSYPRLARKAQARVALGERLDRVYRGLTPREAHEAALEGAAGACEYLCASLPASVAVPRYPAVARWLARSWADPARRAALETEREHHGPGGAVVRGKLVDRVDELHPVDLRGPEGAGVQAVFARAARRAYAEWSTEHETDEAPLASAPAWWRGARCAKLLLTRAALIREGRAQSHCVGGYADVVRSGRSVVVSIAILGADGTVERSTAEIDRATIAVRQHRAHSNKAPSAICERALEVLRRRWLAAKGGDE